MFITEINVTDLSNDMDALGHVALTTDAGICHLDCHVDGQGSATSAHRRAILVEAALDQIRRIPTHRRNGVTFQFANTIEPLAA